MAGRAGRSPTWCRSTRARDSAGTSAVARRRMSAATSGSGWRSHSPASSVPPTTMSRLRGMTYVGPSSASHHSSSPTCSTTTTWPRTGVTDGSPASSRASRAPSSSRPAAPRAGAPAPAGSRCRRPPRPARGSHARYTRHLDHRRHERPAVGVRRGAARTRSSAGTAPTHHGSGVGSCSTSVPRRITTPVVSSAASRASSSYVARAPGGDLVLREGEVGVPDARPRRSRSSPAAGRARARRRGGRPRAAGGRS